MIDEKWINSYLYFGYVPQLLNDQSSLVLAQSDSEECTRLGSLSVEQLLAEGVDTLKSAFNPVNITGLNVLPLSGGLDSRAILGGLLEHFTTSEILTVTFGSPGTLDYEIGQYVSRKVGVKCEAFDLTVPDWEWDAHKLQNIASHNGYPVNVFCQYINYQIPLRLGIENTYWSGFMGDAISGAHLPQKKNTSWASATANFINWNCGAPNIKLVPPGFDPTKMLPENPFFEMQQQSYDDQLDFLIRQQCYIKPTVLFNGYQYRLPFLNQEWLNYILCVPRGFRQNQKLFKEILMNAFPEIFSLPTKTNLGLPLNVSKAKWFFHWSLFSFRSFLRRRIPNEYRGIHPMINYIDFDKGIRTNENLKSVVYESINDLNNRGIVEWIDIHRLWDDHQKGRQNSSDELLLLASLEINLKAMDDENRL